MSKYDIMERKKARSPATPLKKTFSADWVASSWSDVFNELLNDDNELDYGDEWTLKFNYYQTDKVTKEEKKRGWKVFKYSAFGHFKCGSCRNTWPSARVMILFRYRLQRGRGTVIMRPFGQACRRCLNDKFYLPGFETTKMERALLRLFTKIRKYCYGEKDEVHDKSESHIAFTKPHETALCEACRMGICTEKDKK